MAKVKKSVSSKSKQRVGVPGFSTIGGYIIDNEKNTSLVGSEKYKKFSNIMINTLVVGCGVRFFLNLISSVTWKFEPSDTEDAKSIEFADKMKRIVNDAATPWHRIVRRAAMYRFYGFSIQEWTAKLNSDGYIGFLDIEPRPQSTIERWNINEFGDVESVFQRDPNSFKEIELPRSKLLYIVDDSLNTSPEGVGVFRNIIEASDRLVRYLQLEGFGFEMDVRGVPIGRAPLSKIDAMVRDGDISEADATNLRAPIIKFLENHIKNPKLGLLLDSSTYTSEDEAGTPSSVNEWDIEFVSSDVGSQDSIAKAIERETFYIAMILGIDGLLLGSNSVGTYSLGDNKTGNLSLIVDATMKELAESVQKDLVDVIWALNGWDDELKPRVKTDKVQLKAVKEITEALRDLADSGAYLPPDDPAFNEIRNMLGLSEVDVSATGFLDGALLNQNNRAVNSDVGSNDNAEENLEDLE